MDVTYVPDALRVRVKAIGSLSDDTEIQQATRGQPSTYQQQEARPLDKTDNQFWPYLSEQEKLKEEVSGLPPPTIDKESGMQCCWSGGCAS